MVRTEIVKHGKREFYDSKYPLLRRMLKAFKCSVSIAEPGINHGDVERRDISLPG
jgi:hypothetical protein